MPTNPTYRLPAAVIEADREALLALQDLADYAPNNPSHGAETLLTLQQAMERADAAEVRAQKALVAARDTAIEAAWEFHNAMLGAKSQVIGQYGNNSQAVQALGLKKKSDRKRSTRRAA
jgi:hypothetical protein